MKTLAEVKSLCHIDGSHWIWRGAMSAGRPNLTAPDYTTAEGRQKSQRGPRAVWHIKSKKPIPQGFRVFHACEEPCCVNPDHIVCRDYKEWAREMSLKGIWKGNPKQIVANRTKNMRRSSVTPEILKVIESSPDKTGRQLAQELGLRFQTVSRIRRGEFYSLALANPFAGLVR